jgi:hypothetical protein
MILTLIMCAMSRNLVLPSRNWLSCGPSAREVVQNHVLADVLDEAHGAGVDYYALPVEGHGVP